MKEELIAIAKKNLADLLTVAPSSRFPEDDPIFRIMPEVQSVVCLGFRLLRGAFRGIEEGSTYYQYSTMAVETMEETIMPAALFRVAAYLEEQGYICLPQKLHQTIMQEVNSTNPEMAYRDIYRGRVQENQMHFEDAAVRCGLGERGLHGSVLTDEFGPLVRYCFLLTNALLPPDPVKQPHLCDKCGACIAACPGHAIQKDGQVDPWQCAVYYAGANGTKNPFMNPDAFPDFKDRLQIIAGEARVTPEKARKILDEVIFYPSPKHSYQSSICGKACDLDCYCHLEEQGKLTAKYVSPFRKREKWQFSIEDFE